MNAKGSHYNIIRLKVNANKMLKFLWFHSVTESSRRAALFCLGFIFSKPRQNQLVPNSS
jgi:hypothetical protein